MRAISLFSGAGGFELGFDRAGIHTVLQAESDPWCLQVLERHWPDVERVTDVRSVGHRGEPTRRDIADGLRPRAEGQRREAGAGIPGSVDLIYGGFPCQDVSVAGRRAGLRGERSSLWHEFERVLRELRPRWAVVENVPGLFSSNDGRDFLTILRGLDDLGYGVAWRVLDARYFGVPQRRRRVFLVGCLGEPTRAAQVLAVCAGCSGHPAPRRETGEGLAYSLAASARGTGDGHGNAWNSTYVTAMSAKWAKGSGGPAGDEVQNLILANGLRASDGHHDHSSPRGDGADNLIAFDWQASDGGSDDSFNGKPRKYIVRAGDYAGISATRHDAISNTAGVRRLTPRECERLMGWPDEHTRWTADGKEIPDSHRYRLCGNGVVAPVAEWIGHRLVLADQFLQEQAA